MPLDQFASQLGLSELQLALGAVGVLFLVWVVIYNVRNARAKSKASQERAEPSSNAFHEEPSEVSPVSVHPVNQFPAPQMIDPRIDCVITLRFNQAISGVEILEALKSWSDLPIAWMADGLHATSPNEGVWETLEADHSYLEIQLAVQLASRRGPIGVLELSDFCSRVQVLAESLDAQIDMPAVNAMLESAKELDALAAQSDILLGMNIVFDQQTWSWPHIESALTQRGYRMSPQECAFEYAVDSKPIFRTGTFDRQAPIGQITFLLEVPVVAQHLRPFELMLNEAADVAQALQGRLVDDNGVHLTENSVYVIRQQLESLYAQLDKAGIPAGSSTALRLFS
jgi:ZipA, C-terminal FtsZ-binding domain